MNCSDVEGGGSVQGKDKGKSKSKKRSSSGGGEKKRDTTAATLANINRRRQKVEETAQPSFLLPSTNTSLNPTRANQSSGGTSKHKIDAVIFSGYEIQAWYASPYPIDDIPIATASPNLGASEPMWAGGKGKGKVVRVESNNDHSSSLSQSHQSSASNVASTSESTSLSYQAATAATVNHDGLETSSFGFRKSIVPGLSTKKDPVRLYVCDGCFKYTLESVSLSAHLSNCGITSPPGLKLYEDGDLAIWEVDGATDKLYCQNLSLFGKMFIDHKYVFFDVEGFQFYVLTKRVASFNYVVGFFSKEKLSYDEYNLACIMTFPPYQQKGYGSLLIEFSYELSRRNPTRNAGTPERPLSDLGMKSYLNYWTGVLVRYFKTLFDARGVALDDDIHGTSRKSRRGSGASSSSTGKKRKTNGKGKGKRLPNDDESEFEFATTLEGIARATGLRPDDVAFTLVGIGLAQWRRKIPYEERISGEGDDDGDGEEGEDNSQIEQVVITEELIERVEIERKVKPECLKRECFIA